MNNINWNKISDNPDVIRMLKEIKSIEDKINNIDKSALLKFQLELIRSTSIPEWKVSERSYTEKVPSKHLIAIDFFDEMIDDGSIMEDDGIGYWCKDGISSGDDVFSTPRLDATHVAWYNK